ncbi:MAG: zinc ribbon domain-containing protein [Thermoplasmatales archaeon]|nr:zinc ribbon domain-containing protein [Thermoplasmatales archaeon]
MKKNVLILGIILFATGALLFSIISPAISFSGISGSGTNTGLITAGAVLWIVGLILMPIGSILSFAGIFIYLKSETEPYNLDPFKTTPKIQTRYCPNCGRSIPFDSVICPYCSKKY